MAAKYRIIFMGTPEFAVPSLQALLDHGEEVVAVVCQPDKPKGRGRKLSPPPVKELALVIKSDVQGSAEALTAGVEKLATAAVKLRVIHSGVGGITESDVLLAAASNAIIIGFNVRPEPKASALAEQQGVDYSGYQKLFSAEVAFGRRLEPWFVALSARQASTPQPTTKVQ